MAIDNTGKSCQACKKGHYREMSQYDDWHGKVTCPLCGHQVKRYQEDKNYK